MIKQKKFKIDKLKTLAKRQSGKINITNNNIEDHERATITYLARFGFDIETVTPSDMPHSNNPDILMMGTSWEIKAPRSSNAQTLKKRFRKAVRQSGGKAVFDLRNIRGEGDATKAEQTIMKLFREITGMRRIIIIRKDGEALDIIK